MGYEVKGKKTGDTISSKDEHSKSITLVQTTRNKQLNYCTNKQITIIHLHSSNISNS